MIYLDSVKGAAVISCDFGAVGPNVDIVAPATYSDANPSPVRVRWSRFRKAAPIGPGLIDISECVGWTTKQTVAVIMPATATTVACPLAISVTPTVATKAMAQGANLGAIWCDNYSTTGMYVHCAIAPTTDTTIIVTVEGDFWAGPA